MGKKRLTVRVLVDADQLGKQKADLEGVLGHDEKHFLWGLVTLLDEVLARALAVEDQSHDEPPGAADGDEPVCGDCAHRHDEHDELGLCERSNCDCGGWVEA